MNAILCEDLDEDGVLDLLLAGNEYQADVMIGRYDASYGCFLKGDGQRFVQCHRPYQGCYYMAM